MEDLGRACATDRGGDAVRPEAGPGAGVSRARVAGAAEVGVKLLGHGCIGRHGLREGVVVEVAVLLADDLAGHVERGLPEPGRAG